MKSKKEQPVRQEQSLTIDINLTRGLLILLALVLVTAACLGYLAWGQKEAAASAPAAPAAFAGMRKYYMTQSGVDGDEALSACAAGYHMASLWEILDPTDLEYNSDLGYARADSGAGPPTHLAAWVRTGWNTSLDTGIAGQDNCEVWASDDPGHQGTIAQLPRDWASSYEDMEIHIWDVTTLYCNTTWRVWCVED